MNASIRIAAVSALLPVLAGCPKTPTSGKVTTTAYRQQRVTLPEPENPVVAVRLVFRTGSADDPEGKEGLTALTASLMAEGGTEALSSSELIRALYPMAAQIAVQVDREMTVFFGRCHKDHLATFLPILAEVVTSPRMDPKEFERLKVDAINAITLRLRSADDEQLGKETLETMLAPGHPYAHPPVGTESGLRGLALADAVAHRKAAFGRARLTIGIGGGYDDRSFGRFEATLSGLPAGLPPVTPQEPSDAEERNFLIVEKPTRGTAMSLGFNTDVKRGHADFHKLRLAMGYFGEHRQQVGLLFDEIREERGLNYGTYAYAEEFEQQGWGRFPRTNIPRTHQHAEIWIRPVETANAVFALRAALWNFDRLVNDGLSERDFEATREYLAGYSRLWTQTIDRRVGYAVDDLFYGTPDYVESFREALKTMTAEEVNAALARHYGGRALQIALVTGDGDALKDQLTSREATPPDYGKPGEAPPKPPEVRKEDEIIQSFPLDAPAERVKVVPASTMFE